MGQWYGLPAVVNLQRPRRGFEALVSQVETAQKESPTMAGVTREGKEHSPLVLGSTGPGKGT
jgi:hypothetical protein